MQQLPENLDFQAANILLEAFKGNNTDLPEIVTAGWNVAGWCLHLGLPLVVRDNPMMGAVSDDDLVTEIEGLISDPQVDHISKGVLSSAAIAFLLRIALKYILNQVG